jgi:hypothetical protein
MSRVQEIEQRVYEIQKSLKAKNLSDSLMDDLLCELDVMIEELEEELINEASKIK